MTQMIPVNSDIEDHLHRAANMASILVTLAEKVFVDEHYGDAEYHDKRRKEGYRSCEPLYINRDDEGTLLFALYETHAQIREAFNLFTGFDDDGVPLAEAADANGRAVRS
jgi:hypothetical protein